MAYGDGKAADNICSYCGRGGARSFGGGGWAHKQCIQKYRVSPPDPPCHWWACPLCGTINKTVRKHEPDECGSCHKATTMDYRGHGTRPTHRRRGSAMTLHLRTLSTATLERIRDALRDECKCNLVEACLYRTDVAMAIGEIKLELEGRDVST